jgi:hypothetical protein
LAAALLQCGIPAAVTYLDRIPAEVTPDGLVVVSHVIAWDKEDGQRLLRFAEDGGRLVIDAASGRRDGQARMHYPWPGGLAEGMGLRARELESRADGYPLELGGRSAGKLLLARLQAVFDEPDRWSAWPEPRFQDDGQPLVWQRPCGHGRVIVVRGYLAASCLYDPQTMPVVDFILRKAGEELAGNIRPVSPSDGVLTIPVEVEHGELAVMLAEGLLARQGRPVYLHAAARARYHDFWSGKDVATGPDGELVLESPDGIALLWKP